MKQMNPRQLWRHEHKIEQDRSLDAKFPLPELAALREHVTRAAYRWMLYSSEPLAARTPEAACERYGISVPPRFRLNCEEDGILSRQLEIAGFTAAGATEATTPLPSMGSLKEAEREIAERQGDIERLRVTREQARLALDAAETVDAKSKALQLLARCDSMLERVTGLDLVLAVAKQQALQATKQPAPEPPSRPASGRIVTME